MVLGEALSESHKLHRHHAVVLPKFSLNFSSLLAGSRRRIRPQALVTPPPVDRPDMSHELDDAASEINDAHISNARELENAETDEYFELPTTPRSPIDYEFPYVPESYVVDEEISRELLAFENRAGLRKLVSKLKEKSMMEKMKRDPKFATSPIFVIDKDYEFSVDRIGNCFMAKGPKISHPEYFDFNSDEDDLLGDDDLFFEKTSGSNENEFDHNHASQDKSCDDDKKEIERLTKELNTLKLAHESTLEDHRDLARTHEKILFEKLNLDLFACEHVNMSSSEDSQNDFREESMDVDSGTSPEKTASHPGTPSYHDTPKASTRSRKKLNSDEEDANFIPEESISHKQKERVIVKKTLRK
ncbi:hypothetical protein ZWY2020_024242 [Hordeum vulgare]|nr:hypothetical protein ZWY2020_024242 [Hordeum vulgare]